MVAASQPLAVQAGLDALRDGGNAVDAALAAAITLTVVEPANNGVGGDAFAQVWDGQQLVGLNASGRAPEGWNPARFAGRKTMPRLGWDSVTVPGAISAWVALSDRFGHLPFTRLFDAAIHYARVGFQVGPKTAEIWSRAQARYADFPDFAEHFLPAPKAGRRVCRPALARTLQELADSHGSSFYTGAIAARIERAAIAAGGAMRRTDLANHRAEWVTPLRQPYRKALVHELPPNGQGIAALVALGILQHRELEPLDSANGVHLVLEATRIAIRAAFEHVAEPQSLAVAAEALLDPTLLARLAEGITDRAAPRPPAILPTNQDTVCLAAADSSGMMVSFIQSNYEGFGSGIVIPDSGIAMHNRGAGFSLTPGHPNQVGPGKRPFHTIIPGFVTGIGQASPCFRPDGRAHAASGARADGATDPRPRTGPAGRQRRTSLAHHARRSRATRTRLRRFDSRRPGQARPQGGIASEPGHLWRRPADPQNRRRLYRRFQTIARKARRPAFDRTAPTQPSPNPTII